MVHGLQGGYIIKEGPSLALGLTPRVDLSVVLTEASSRRCHRHSVTPNSSAPDTGLGTPCPRSSRRGPPRTRTARTPPLRSCRLRFIRAFPEEGLR